jgi:hypothetical protein
MNQDADFLKAMRIEPCSIQEPTITSVECCVDGNAVMMDLTSFQRLLGANHDLGQQLTEAREQANESTRDMRNWRFAFYVLAVGMVVATVIAAVPR